MQHTSICWDMAESPRRSWSIIAPDGVDEAAGGRVAVLERDHVRPFTELVHDNQDLASVEGAVAGVYLLKRSRCGHGAERLALVGWQPARALLTASGGVGDVDIYIRPVNCQAGSLA